MTANNYSFGFISTNNSYSIFKKTYAALKAIVLSIMLLASVAFNNAFSQVTITAPSLTVTACTAFPTSSSTLGDIVITENAAGDISGSGTLILTAPANFEFTSAGTAAATGTEITGVSTVLTNSTTITITFTVGGIIEINTMTLSGIQVIGITAATASSDVIRTGGTSVINGDGNGDVNAALTSLLGPPALSSSLAPPAICSGAAFTYTPASGTSGATFTWTRAAVTGISNIANSGTDNANETLYNTTANPVGVTYVYSVSAYGCLNPSTFSVALTVNPTPTLSSLLISPAICNGTAFSYTPTSDASGAAFAWARAALTGISNTAASGSGSVSEILNDSIVSPENVIYVYTTSESVNGCNGNQNVSVFVNPTPTLSSSLTPPAICGDSTATFSYTPTSGTSGASFAWTRAALTGISNTAGSGSANPNEALNDTTAAPINVTYIFSVSANGCTNAASFSVVVAVSICSCNQTLSSTLTPAAICSGSTFSYMPTSSTSGAAFAWTRAAVSGISNTLAAGTGNPNETLVNTTAAPINVTYVFAVTAHGCTNPTTYHVIVKVNPTPALSSSLTPADVCSGSTFNYAPASLTTGAVFAWTRAAVTGISNAAGSGSGHINEILINTTAYPVNVNYIFTVTANGCLNPAPFIVTDTVNPKPTASLLPFTPVCSQAAMFVLTGGSPSGGTYSGTGVISGVFHPGSAGAVQAIVYTVTNSFNCSNAASQNLIVHDCTGIEENSTSTEVAIYPNPANGILNIAVKNADFTDLLISIFNIQGKEIFNTLYKDITADFNKQISLEDLAKGIYYIKINTGSSVQMKKLIIQ